ncbi:hypothetical protein [Aureimonas sp. Leaf454]|uniref:hypothetical protein n=1 Tax=Aureimonas sp. Leaf454 TaxID=1736381 RepID=UPI0012E35C0B|nr:hypothetical protein [Aureimonas sp. Leaf454]
MQDIIASLISFFLIQPIQAEMTERLSAARAPVELVETLTGCIADAGPAVVRRASDDPLWAIGSAAGILVGLTAPDAVLVEAAPGCAQAVSAVRPYLDEGEA